MIWVFNIKDSQVYSLPLVSFVLLYCIATNVQYMVVCVESMYILSMSMVAVQHLKYFIRTGELP